MLLAADASVLVAELPRERGKRLVEHLDLQLIISDQAWSETRHELPRRLAERERHGRLGPGGAESALRECLRLVARHIEIIPSLTYSHLQAVALRRVPRDPNDWPSAALALTLECGIWTADADFLGCGVPTWTTETLGPHLEA